MSDPAPEVVERLRRLSDRELLALALLDREANASGLWRHAYHEVERREAERGHALTWHNTRGDL
jgi:hypothetical protein